MSQSYKQARFPGYGPATFRGPAESSPVRVRLYGIVNQRIIKWNTGALLQSGPEDLDRMQANRVVRSLSKSRPGSSLLRLHKDKKRKACVDTPCSF